jgi:hypothetical protein
MSKHSQTARPEGPASKKSDSSEFPTVNKVAEWASRTDGTMPLLLVPDDRGTDLSRYLKLRDPAYNANNATRWIDDGLIRNLAERLAATHVYGSNIPHKWDLLWSLIRDHSLKLDTPLREVVDKGGLLTTVFRAIWQIRFMLHEGSDIFEYVDALAHWLSGAELSEEDTHILEELNLHSKLESFEDRLQVLLFVATWAAQIQLLDRIVFLLEGLDRGLSLPPRKRGVFVKELQSFLMTLKTWESLESPCRFLMTFSEDARPLGRIETLDPSLAKHLSGRVLGVLPRDGRD